MSAKTSKKATVQADADGAPPSDGTPSAETVRKAIDELGLNRPFYTCRVVGNRLEFSVYGGDLVYWPLKRTRSRRGGS